jgi:hypothetical protein
MKMQKVLLLFLFFAVSKIGHGQKVDSIYFHLYTDSLKKGFYNYINVDGKTTDGRWMPLSSQELQFVVKDTTSLRFQNNDLFIDSSYRYETVTVKAFLKSNPAVWKETTIYIRKRGFDEPLKTNEDVLRDINSQGRNRRNNWRYSLL